ncbi:MAG: hypothetical protein JNL67_21715 [Planctomycetaceae bacterium]|nr:hypothetical protein [Planctomycetaceae bacterium]
MTEKQGSFRVGPVGFLVVGLDTLICIFNGFAVGWMIYKAFVEKNIEYTDRQTFVNTAIAALSIVALFGTLGNLLLLIGVRIGVRLASYRIALGIGSIILAWVMMFFLCPKPEKIMSEANFNTYAWFVGVGVAYLLWIIVYWTTVASTDRRSRQPVQG